MILYNNKLKKSKKKEFFLFLLSEISRVRTFTFALIRTYLLLLYFIIISGSGMDSWYTKSGFSDENRKSYLCGGH